MERAGDCSLYIEMSTTSTLAANTTTEISSGISELFTAKVTVQTMILALAIFGNSCLLLVLRRRKSNFTRMHVFITHLCFTDMLVAFFNILPQLIWDILEEWKAGDLMCRLVKFMQVFVMYLSTYVLVLTALDRRRAICSPLLSHTWTYRLVHLSVGGVYVLSAVLSLPQAIIFKYQETEQGPGVKDCWVHFHPKWTLQFYITAFTILVYIIPLCILVFAYGSIYYTIFVRQKQSKKENSVSAIRQDNSHESTVKTNGIVIHHLDVANLSSNGKHHKRQAGAALVPRTNSFAGFTRAKMKTVKLTFIIILAYLGCWSPFFISQLWWLYDESAPANNSAIVIMILLASLNSCCNPWIYMTFSGSLPWRTVTSYRCCCNKGVAYFSARSNHFQEQQSNKTKMSLMTTPLTPTPSTSTRLFPTLRLI